MSHHNDVTRLRTNDVISSPHKWLMIIAYELIIITNYLIGRQKSPKPKFAKTTEFDIGSALEWPVRALD